MAPGRAAGIRQSNLPDHRQRGNVLPPRPYLVKLSRNSLENLTRRYGLHALWCSKDACIKARAARHIVHLHDPVDLSTWSVPLTSLGAEKRGYRGAECVGNVHRSAVRAKQEITLRDQSHESAQI